MASQLNWGAAEHSIAVMGIKCFMVGKQGLRSGLGTYASGLQAQQG